MVSWASFTGLGGVFPLVASSHHVLPQDFRNFSQRQSTVLNERTGYRVGEAICIDYNGNVADKVLRSWVLVKESVHDPSI